MKTTEREMKDNPPLLTDLTSKFVIDHQLNECHLQVVPTLCILSDTQSDLGWRTLLDLHCPSFILLDASSGRDVVSLPRAHGVCRQDYFFSRNRLGRPRQSRKCLCVCRAGLVVVLI